MASSAQDAERHVLLVVGSINADTYIELDRLPAKGETLAGRDDSGWVKPGGKGANQAVAAARLLLAESLAAEAEDVAAFAAASATHKVQLAAKFGNDAHVDTLWSTCKESGVDLSLACKVGKPSGQAFIMLYPDGENSIIIVGGANADWSEERQEMIAPELEAAIKEKAKVVLLQREIPEYVNVAVAELAAQCGVRVVMDVGGRDTPLEEGVLKHLFVLSPNETELARITGMETETREQVLEAAQWLMDKGVQYVLVKLGARGSLLLGPDGLVVEQEAVKPPAPIVDTTGAGDSFTAAFAVGIAEGKGFAEAMRFASAAASIAITTKGAMPSMPDRTAVEALLARD